MYDDLIGQTSNRLFQKLVALLFKTCVDDLTNVYIRLDITPRFKSLANFCFPLQIYIKINDVLQDIQLIFEL